MIIISFEGIDGAGKTTQIKLLGQYLHSKSIPHICTQELYGKDVRIKLREVLMLNLDPIEELTTISTARRWHCRNIVEPNLAQGNVVLMDRFTESTWAYQGGGRGIDIGIIQFFADNIWGAKPADLIVYLYGKTHRALKQDKFEREKQEFFERASAIYEQRKGPNWLCINSDQTTSEIHQQICERVQNLLKIDLLIN